MESNDTYLNKPLDQLREELGQPIENMGTIQIWKKESSFIVGGFSYDSNAWVLTDFIEFTHEFNTLTSTIDTLDTTDNILTKIKDKTKIENVYDTGSGVELKTKICCDGYLVIWNDEGSEVKIWLYDYRNQKEVSLFQYTMKKLFNP